LLQELRFERAVQLWIETVRIEPDYIDVTTGRRRRAVVQMVPYRVPNEAGADPAVGKVQLRG